MNHNLFEEYNSDPSRILQDIQSYLEKRQYEVYESVEGLCNPIVSKNPFISQFLTYYLKDQEVSVTPNDFIKTLAFFILHTSKTLTNEVLLILFTSKQSKHDAQERPVIISFFNYHKKNDSLFDELYLPGLQKELKDKNIEYIYLPKLHAFPKNPFKAISAMKELKKQNPSLMTPYEFIPRLQVITLVYLTLAHFFYGLKSLRLFSKNKMDQFYNKSLVQSLKTSEANKFLYYLSTKEFLKKRTTKKIILWFENQSIDKCILRAIRESGLKIEVMASQFFLVTPREMNLFPSLFEIEHHYIPDKIFTIQTPPEMSPISQRYKLGKGLRYLYLQKYNLSEINFGNKKYYSVFLTIFRDKNNLAFELLIASFLKNEILYFKKHPGLALDPIPANKNWTVVNETQEELILKSEIVFVTDTGLIYEAISMARQVVILGAKNTAYQLIPPVEYKDKLWAYVADPQQLEIGLAKLLAFKQNNSDELRSLAKKAKATYFQNSPLPITEIFEF